MPTPFALQLATALQGAAPGMYDEGDDLARPVPLPQLLPPDPFGGVPSHVRRQQQHAAFLGQQQAMAPRENSDPNMQLALAGAEAIQSGLPKGPQLYPGQAHGLSPEAMSTWKPPMMADPVNRANPGFATPTDLYNREVEFQRQAGSTSSGRLLSTPGASREQLMAEMAPVMQQFAQSGRLAPSLPEPTGLRDRMLASLDRRTPGNPEFAMLAEGLLGMDRNAASMRQADADMMRGQAAMMGAEDVRKTAPLMALIRGQEAGLGTNPQFSSLLESTFGVKPGVSGMGGAGARAAEQAKANEKALGPGYKKITDIANRLVNPGMFGFGNRATALRELQGDINAGIASPDALDAVITEIYSKGLMNPMLAGDIKMKPELQMLRDRMMGRPEWAQALNAVRPVDVPFFRNPWISGNLSRR